ncbi:class I SAM-dependent methyltransferase [Vibrio profundum]|uniref:class I SAM-dependent methyltransferase n=1 Tax=Vibrio profundum TaxID=2910247 RepID=UPI003D14B24C
MSETISIYDSVAPNYDSRYQTPDCLIENQQVLSLINTTSNLGRVLDIGCGTGLLYELLTNSMCIPHFSHYTGVDPSKGMIDNFSQKLRDADNRVKLLNDTVESCTLTECYDSIFSLFGAISYVEPSYIRSLTINQGVLMFYRSGYRPDYLPMSVKTYTAQDSGLEVTHRVNNFDVVVFK